VGGGAVMHGRKNARRETRVVVLTGPPCCGKTTLVKKLAAEFAEVRPESPTAHSPKLCLTAAGGRVQHAAPLIVGGLRVCGFVTEELRGQNGQRTGFDVLSIDGRCAGGRGHTVRRRVPPLIFLVTPPRSKRSALARRDGPAPLSHS
jgi:hypothetical protein